MWFRSFEFRHFVWSIGYQEAAESGAATEAKSGAGGNPYFILLNKARSEMKTRVGGRTLTAAEMQLANQEARDRYNALTPDETAALVRVYEQHVRDRRAGVRPAASGRAGEKEAYKNPTFGIGNEDCAVDPEAFHQA